MPRFNPLWIAMTAWLLAALLPAPALAQARLPAELEAYISRSMAEAEIPGLAVALVHGDEPAIAQGFGVRRLGRPERIDADTVFNIASLTKSFTAAAAAVLVTDGRMSWTDRAARWLPQLEFSDPWLTEHVTLADLLSHRTGLESANTAWYLTGIDRAEIVRRVRYLRPASAFRTQQEYNNGLYTVAGEVIAAAAGTSFEEHVRRRLIEPLGMRHTLIGQPPTRTGNVATPHGPIGGRQQPIPFESYVTTAPAGGVESTANDMVRWLRFQLGDGSVEGRLILSAEAMQAMHEPWVMIPTTPAMRAGRQVQFFGGYGLGWNVMDYRGRKVLWHSGNARGMPSFMALLPEQRIGVVVMLNGWGAPFLHNDIISRIFDHYLGLPTRDYAAETLRATREAQARVAAAAVAPPAAALSPLDLAAYEGEYRADLWGPIRVSREGAGLKLALGEGEQADLLPLNRDTFTVRWRDRAYGEFADTRVTFALDDQGRVARLRMQVRRDLVEASR